MAATRSQHRGMVRLMLKFPRVRGALQLLEVRKPTVINLYEAYEDACSTLETLQVAALSDPVLLAEYAALCTEIETDVIALCLAFERNGS
ncbi:hypothetical protein [Rhizobium sp. CCGE 510]|uniref:hypothetical protein n=1 Tax=Rhizobium sp. CCGE 510 TaxID=1132836 RepID=UPI00178C7259|nr:hypothetical protein [Rhizobium sp. CCGE 510]